MNPLELVGYAASVLIAVSLMMSSVLRLRIINLVGAVLFTVYGGLIGAYPVAVVNFVIVLIDIYYLAQMLRAREYFTLLEVGADSSYLRYFLSYYRDDIQRFVPDFAYEPRAGQVSFFVLRNMVPAGVFVGEVEAPGCLRVQLDYVIPGYRDFKSARYVFGQQAEFFRQRGIRRVCTPPGSPAHRAYLERMGFTASTGENGGSEYCMVIQ